MTRTLSHTSTVVDSDWHVLRVEDGEYALYARSPQGLQPLGRWTNPAAAMDVLDRLDLAA